MKILTTLWGELKGVFGKSYLLAGALPAGLLVLGWIWYESRKSLPWLVGQTLDALSTESPADKVVATVLFALALGLAFFAGRGPLLDLLQRLPGRALARLRRELTRRQHARWLRIEREADVGSHLETLLDKWVDPQGFGQPEFLPPTEKVPKAPEMRTLSRKARRTLQGLMPGGVPPTTPPTPKQTKVLCDGLRALYAFAHQDFNHTATTEEIAAWKKLVESPAVRRSMLIVHDGVHRDWAEARTELDGYPEPRWLRPTALGTRASALDDYAEDRYGIPTSTLLHRLLGALPDDVRKGIADARLQVETLTNLAAAAVLLGVAVTVGSAVTNLRYVLRGGLLVHDLRTAAFILLPAFFGWLFYRGAVLAYGELSEKLVRGVDLHRLDLVEKLGFARPRDAREEHELWSELAAFYSGDGDLDPDRPIVPKE